VTLHIIGAGLMEIASLERPDRIKSESRQLEYTKDLSIQLEPYTVAVLEIRSL
jgi:alpha-N-arabinofuranosidase